MRSLIASASITILGLVACPLHVTGQEIAGFSLSVGSHEADGQRTDVEYAIDKQDKRKGSAATRIAEHKTDVADIREIYDPLLEAQMKAAQPAGFLGRVFGGAGAMMIGAWSGSQAECTTNRLLFFEDANSKPTVAWWTQPLSLRDGGLIPSLTGEWELRDHVVSMNFDETTALQPFTGGTVSSRPTDINVRLEFVQEDEGRLLLLRLPDNNLTLAAAELLDGAGEKSFVRCANLS